MICRRGEGGDVSSRGKREGLTSMGPGRMTGGWGGSGSVGGPSKDRINRGCYPQDGWSSSPMIGQCVAVSIEGAEVGVRHRWARCSSQARTR